MFCLNFVHIGTYFTLLFLSGCNVAVVDAFGEFLMSSPEAL